MVVCGVRAFQRDVGGGVVITASARVSPKLAWPLAPNRLKNKEMYILLSASGLGAARAILRYSYVRTFSGLPRPKMSGKVFKVLVTAINPSSENINTLVAIANNDMNHTERQHSRKRVRLAVCFHHQESSAGGAVDDVVRMYLAATTDGKLTIGAWRSKMPFADVIQAYDFSDEKLVDLVKRGTQPLQEFFEHGDSGPSYGGVEVTEVFTYGDTSHQGKSTGLPDTVRAMRDGGDTLLEVQQSGVGGAAPYQYRNCLALIERDNMPKRNVFEHVEVTVLVGASGSGKSRYVDHIRGDGEIYKWTALAGTTFFDGYKGHEVVHFSGFEGQLTFRALVELLDGSTDTLVQVKNGHVPWCPKRIFIETHKQVEEWYPGRDDISCLTRRITRTIVFPRNQPNTPQSSPARRRRRVV
jgi:hypothetical protein